MAQDARPARYPARRSHGSVRINKARREQFLEILAETASVTAAARAAGVYRVKWYRLRKADPAFDAAWHEALEIGIDAVEDEAVRRAVEGHDEPVYFQGQKVGATRKYSDRMLMLLLRARRPALYGDGGEGGGRADDDDIRSLLREIDGGDVPRIEVPNDGRETTGAGDGSRRGGQR